ncbi:DUF4249 domain-containing protein [Runella zeae]|uniref:DUF4249 domain-containing protein n=1 Tax=Runella zeae TaxID=94255 RepID=UPI0003FC24EC|nr:DUF4249 domain-containing protein [Runella zeae]
MKTIISLVLLALVCTACEKTVTLDYKVNQSKVIIDGNITNATGPYFVKITKSLKLIETGTYPTIDNAVVSIRDDAGNRETLTPRGNGIYQTASLKGVPGRTYTLTVQAENQTYVAQSTMPQQVSFESIKVEEVVFTGETEYNLIPVYNDPMGKGNNYRFVVSVNDKLINQHFIQNDEVKNGVVNTLRLEINDDEVKLKKGDAVNITMQCIDANAALFYKTLMLIGDSGPGGGITPTNPPSNISNGSLGVFSAHTIDTKGVKL